MVTNPAAFVMAWGWWEVARRTWMGMSGSHWCVRLLATIACGFQCVIALGWAIA